MLRYPSWRVNQLLLVEQLCRLDREQDRNPITEQVGDLQFELVIANDHISSLLLFQAYRWIIAVFVETLSTPISSPFYLLYSA